MTTRICFVELPARSLAPTKTFYATAFGLSMTDFGPTYACTLNGGADLGLQGDASEATVAPLPVIEVESLEKAETAVRAAGGVITKPAFSFPGGRRFHFRDPSGNELSAMQVD